VSPQWPIDGTAVYRIRRSLNRVLAAKQSFVCNFGRQGRWFGERYDTISFLTEVRTQGAPWRGAYLIRVGKLGADVFLRCWQPQSRGFRRAAGSPR